MNLNRGFSFGVFEFLFKWSFKNIIYFSVYIGDCFSIQFDFLFFSVSLYVDKYFFNKNFSFGGYISGNGYVSVAFFKELFYFNLYNLFGKTICYSKVVKKDEEVQLNMPEGVYFGTYNEVRNEFVRFIFYKKISKVFNFKFEKGIPAPSRNGHGVINSISIKTSDKETVSDALLKAAISINLKRDNSENGIYRPENITI